jgi:glycosyltransferase involved in cell wall biosynthesis
MRLTIVQYAGDYKEACERFETGGKATYQAQRYSIELVASLAKRLEQVSVICATTDAAYDTVLANRVRAIGAGLLSGFLPRELLPLVARTEPDRLILVTPMVPLLNWARRHRVRTLATLADSFQQSGLGNSLRQWRLARALNRPIVDWVGNHGIGASLSLRNIGVDADKIVPWDWPPSHRPSDHAPRTLDRARPFSLVYVGAVSEAKGVGDLLRALQRLEQQEVAPALTVVGGDPGRSMEGLARELDLGQVRFAGLVANEDVPAAMRAADAVVIPSRHEYAEGLPLTIYEALAARTPIIASDHPMFRGALMHEESALVFPAKDVDALASAIRRLGSDPELYARLSSNSEAAWQALQLPVAWGELVQHWLTDSGPDRDWIRERRLTSGLYASQIAARTRT